ncbi:protein kinase domain-containing protein [Trichoderma breve]|uniref:Protein kinase domain-containing protein n=1 Tax=Trichoderma breve TaxID=2034170 RepID=A0A9W9B7U8_9HYPO|nr:protein kinase domain-containing protein [Trichoderma breve]KAJ4858207.1 protein kinase domain-containing protein [Trichoderma breve]
MEDIPMNDLLFWSVLEFTFSNRSTDSEFVMTCHQHRFVVRLTVNQFVASPQLREKYLIFLDVAEQFELGGYTVDDFYDWVAEPMLPIFRELSSSDNIGSTLDEFLFPETHVHELFVDGDKMVAEEQQEAEDIPQGFGVSFPEDTDFTPWPTFTQSETRRIFLNDGTAAYMELMDPGNKSSLLHEISTYRKIHDAHLDKTLRISRLIGLVQARDDEEVIIYGLLLTYIDCDHMTLFCAVQPETPANLRTRWATQVGDTLAQLHEAGIVWGDAKPENVLVDQHDDAWIIEFGGGYMEGWVEQGLAGTREGDLQALGRITEFIHATEEPTNI